MEKCRGLIGNNRNYSYYKKQKGQLALEAVLLMTILLGLFLMVMKYVQKEQMVQNLVGPTIGRLKTMTAMGTWRADGCTAPGRSRQTPGKCHPNSIHRSLSSDPGP